MSEGHHTVELLWKAFNILLFLGIAYWFGRKPVSQMFNTFYQNLTKRLDGAEDELKKARADFENAKKAYEDAQRRYREQIELSKQTAKTMKDEELKKANEMVERIKLKTKEAIDIELKKAKQELYEYGLRKTRELAVQMLQDAFKDPKVQQAYIDRSLKSLEEGR